MKNKSFTLIELLVVIAIVGFLATIVLVNVSGSKVQARDAHIKTSMHQVRNAAEMSYTKNNESYTDVCDETDLTPDGDPTLSSIGDFGLLEEAIKKDNGNKDVVCYESSDKKDFAVASPMVYQEGKYWCVESAGPSIELDHLITSAKCE